jgi:hypothetical protein
MIGKQKMNRLLCFLLFSLYASPGYCQVVAIQNLKENLLYVGIDNPLKVAVENSASTTISLTTNNGQITNDGHGQFRISPNRIGLATIYVYKSVSKKRKIVDSMYFQVRRWPVQATFAGRTGGEISAGAVYVQIAPSVIVRDLEIDAKMPILKFTVVVNRQGKEVFKRSLQDPKWTRIDDTTKRFFKTLQNGDKLFFTDFVCKDVDMTERNVPGLEFTITNAETLIEELKHKEKPRMIIDPVTNEEIFIKD